MYELTDFLKDMEKDKILIARLEEAYEKPEEIKDDDKKCRIKDMINIHIHNHIYGVCQCTCNMCNRMNNIVVDHIHNEFKLD
jgi:hypothetical protein